MVLNCGQVAWLEVGLNGEQEARLKMVRNCRQVAWLEVVLNCSQVGSGAELFTGWRWC